jgi:thioredoxin 1
MILTDSNFKEVMGNNLILVDFWAEWCGPCKKLSPILDEISNETNLLVGKMNVDDNPITTLEFNITSIPTMIVFENGIKVKVINGAQPKHKLMKELEPWI